MNRLLSEMRDDAKAKLCGCEESAYYRAAMWRMLAILEDVWKGDRVYRVILQLKKALRIRREYRPNTKR